MPHINKPHINNVLFKRADVDGLEFMLFCLIFWHVEDWLRFIGVTMINGELAVAGEVLEGAFACVYVVLFLGVQVAFHVVY